MMLNENLSLIMLLSGLGAGIIATFATVVIERLGGRLGGIISTLPTTIIPASWGVWSQFNNFSSEFTQEGLDLFASSMYAVPIGMSLNAIFLWLWRFIPPFLPTSWMEDIEIENEGKKTILKRLLAVSVLSLITLSIWFIGALGWVWGSHQYLHEVSTRRSAGVLATLIIILMGLWATYRSHPAPRGSRSISTLTLFARGICACCAVMIAVFISHSGAATLAGVASVFPAIFWTTMVSLWLSQDRAVSAGAVGPMMLGSSSVSVFALLTPWLYPYFGATLGAFMAWMMAALFASTPCYIWLSIRSRQSKVPNEIKSQTND